MKTSRILGLFLSCGGLGYLPMAPGTWASIMAVFFWVTYLRMGGSPWGILLLCGLLTGLGAMATRSYEAQLGKKDSSQIVLDEWIGVGLSLVLIDPFSLAEVAIAFILFRAFDILKPPGVRYFDRHYLRGWGVMLDDVVAGFYVFILIGAYRWVVR